MGAGHCLQSTIVIHTLAGSSEGAWVLVWFACSGFTLYLHLLIAPAIIISISKIGHFSRDSRQVCSAHLFAYILSKPILQTLWTQISLIPREQSDQGS